ncbi:MAG TPA: hypothetical protein VHV51_19570, partial [Polyangiaceae bacterium]|nr:hypothetical protein [Polyangiaceae bacterium]
GPEGGNNGGDIVVAGTPEQVADTPGSHTGVYLKQALADVGKPITLPKPAAKTSAPKHSAAKRPAKKTARAR